MLLPRFGQYLLVALGVLGWWVPFIKPAQAFRVSPVIIDIAVAPGTEAKGQLQVTNTSDQVQAYDLSLQKFVAMGEEGRQTFFPETDTTGIASWIRPEQRRVILQPHETRSVAYAADIPLTAEPGGHYAALFFSSGSNEVEGVSVGVGAKIGVLFLLNVSGVIKEQAQIESFRIMNEGVPRRLPIFFELRVRNVGNVHVRPKGTIVIKNMFGSTVAKLAANVGQDAVLPNSVRRLVSSWERSNGHALQDRWSSFAFGRYTAELQVEYGAARLPLQTTTTFWIFSWRIVLMGILVGILLGLLIRWYNLRVIRGAVARGRKI